MTAIFGCAKVKSGVELRRVCKSLKAMGPVRRYYRLSKNFRIEVIGPYAADLARSYEAYYKYLIDVERLRGGVQAAVLDAVILPAGPSAAGKILKLFSSARSAKRIEIHLNRIKQTIRDGDLVHDLAAMNIHFDGYAGTVARLGIQKA
jgi:hypothetical protein